MNETLVASYQPDSKLASVIMDEFSRLLQQQLEADVRSLPAGTNFTLKDRREGEAK